MSNSENTTPKKPVHGRKSTPFAHTSSHASSSSPSQYPLPSSSPPRPATRRDHYNDPPPKSTSTREYYEGHQLEDEEFPEVESASESESDGEKGNVGKGKEKRKEKRKEKEKEKDKKDKGWGYLLPGKDLMDRFYKREGPSTTARTASNTKTHSIANSNSIDPSTDPLAQPHQRSASDALLETPIGNFHEATQTDLQNREGGLRNEERMKILDELKNRREVEEVERLKGKAKEEEERRDREYDEWERKSGRKDDGEE